MTRTRAWSILFIASAALLGLFLIRDTAERKTVQRTGVQATATPLSEVTPAQGPGSHDPLPAAPSGVSRTPDGARKPASAQASAETLVSGEAANLSPGARVDRATVIALHGSKPLTREHPKVAEAIEIQERHGELLAHPAVVATAIGLNGKGEIALVVYTKKEEAEDIPSSIEGLPVVVWQSGEIVARNNLTPQDAVGTRDNVDKRSHAGGTYSAWYERPVPIGVSTGHPAITAGTIGCRVAGGGNVYALSNNHVYANENRASIGDGVIQPGTVDHGTSNDTIGTLSAFKTIIFGGSPVNPPNTIDAAIALSGLVDTDTPAGTYGSPASVPVEASLTPSPTAVTKVGRTTGETFGKVTGINARTSVQYDQGIARFKEQIIIEPGSFSAGGDSGSLIVTDDVNRSPVGLLFAGSSSITIANRIQNVLGYFGVAVQAGPNKSPHVTISSPTSGSTFSSGAPITFTGNADDSEDVNDLTPSIIWSSSIDGGIGTGGTFTTSTLSAGSHKISASATDSAGKSWSRSISITVGSASSGTVKVTTPSGTTGYATSGGKSNNKNLLVTVTLEDNLGTPVSGSTVSINLANTSSGQAWTGNGTTGSGGTVTFTLNNAPSGIYTTTVTAVGASGWDGTTPSNSYTK